MALADDKCDNNTTKEPAASEGSSDHPQHVGISS